MPKLPACWLADCATITPDWGSAMSKIEKAGDPAALAAVFQEKAIRRILHNDEW